MERGQIYPATLSCVQVLTVLCMQAQCQAPFQSLSPQSRLPLAEPVQPIHPLLGGQPGRSQMRSRTLSETLCARLRGAERLETRTRRSPAQSPKLPRPPKTSCETFCHVSEDEPASPDLFQARWLTVACASHELKHLSSARGLCTDGTMKHLEQRRLLRIVMQLAMREERAPMAVCC